MTRKAREVRIEIGVYQADGPDQNGKWGLQALIANSGQPAIRFTPPDYETAGEAAQAVLDIVERGTVKVAVPESLKVMLNMMVPGGRVLPGGQVETRQVKRPGMDSRVTERAVNTPFGLPSLGTPYEEEEDDEYEDEDIDLEDEDYEEEDDDNGEEWDYEEEEDEDDSEEEEDTDEEEEDGLEPAARMMTLKEIQRQVASWSLNNFGQNQTELLNIVAGQTHGRFQGIPNGSKVELGSLCALMGIVEEVGELEEAVTEADIMDAMGDILIYLCDYSAREGVELDYDIMKRRVFRRSIDGKGKRKNNYGNMTLPMIIGKLNHCTLKRLQGIRGFGGPEGYEKYCSERNKCIEAILLSLCLVAEREEMADHVVLMAVNDTWRKIVSKRDWKADAKEGGSHDHKKGSPGENPQTSMEST